MSKWIERIRAGAKAAKAEFDLVTGGITGRNPLSLDDAVRLFKNDPQRFFYGRDGLPITWPEVEPTAHHEYLPDIYVKVQRHPIGYVKNIVLHPGTKDVVVGHFAVARNLEAKGGLGYVLAYALRTVLLAQFKVRTITFSEDSSRYAAANYPAFFTNLGATALALKPKQTRPDWVWHL